MARRRRTKSIPGGGWVILVGLAFAVLSAAAQFIHDYWPFLLMALGSVGCVWGISRQRKERDSVELATLAAQPSGWSVASQPAYEIPSPSQPLAAFHGLPAQTPDFSCLSSIAPPIATKPAAIMPEPEFRISAIVDTPREPAPSARNKAPAAGGKARWIQPGNAVEIKGVTIGSGMIYVGEKVGGHRWAIENCLIDPTLPVARAGAGSTDGMTYWSRYDAISPANRRAYLEWLASGRCDPSADIGLVFLFFYGLEFRLFKEGAVSDGPRLIAEVERLLGLYGNPSFQGYARRFLEAARLMVPGQPAIRPEIALDPSTYGYELPLDVRVWLGHKLAGAQPFDADDALLWLAALPDRGFRTPVTRCPEEFHALWRLRFADRYPAGLKISAPKGRIKATYRAASGTFEATLKGVHENLPDIGAISAPVKKLRELVEACTTELDAFSRFVGKRPEARSGAQAALLLPREISESGPAWALLQERVETFFAGRITAPVPLADLFGLAELPLPCAGRVPQSVMAQLCQILDRLDIAFEPDRRYGGPLLNADASVCTFRAPDGAPVDPDRAEYLQFRGLIEITCLAAASDGTIAREEIETILVDLRAATALSPAERARLIGYALSIHLDPPKQQAVLKRLAARPLAEREACSRAALAAVMADGYAAPTEVKFLERLHKALSLPIEVIYTAIHRSGTDAPQRLPDAPSVRTATPPDGRPHGTSNVVAIDASRLERIRRETQAVSSLLSDIFVEDAAGGPMPEHPAAAGATIAPANQNAGTANEDRFSGLDPAHADLLAHLLAKGSVSREIFDQEARARKLLPDGALETINEWAFDRLGDALLEGDDDLTIAVHLRDQLAQIKAAA